MKPNSITGQIDVSMCPHCRDVHLVILGEDGTVYFNCGFPDEAWDRIFLSVATLQKQRDQANVH